MKIILEGMEYEIEEEDFKTLIGEQNGKKKKV